jgi:hypothetical protein
LVILEPPLRRRVDQEGSFKVTELQETMPLPSLRGGFPTMEEYIVSDLETEGFSPKNPPIIDLSIPILIQIVPPEVKYSEKQLVL